MRDLITAIERLEAAAGKPLRLADQLDPDRLAAVKRWAEDRDKH